MRTTPHSNAVSSCIRNAVLLCFLGALQELQEQWERARAEEQSRGAGAADVRRWTGIRNIVEAREMLRTLFISACTQRAQVRRGQHVWQLVVDDQQAVPTAATAWHDTHTHITSWQTRLTTTAPRLLLP